MNEERLTTCRIKHRMEKIIMPTMRLLGQLGLILLCVGWAGVSAISIGRFFTFGDFSGMITIAFLDAFVLLIMYMAIVMPPRLSYAPHLACCVVMLIAAALLLAKVIIADYFYATNGFGSLPGALLTIVVSIIAYLVLAYALMVDLCEFEKMIKCPRAT